MSPIAVSSMNPSISQLRAHTHDLHAELERTAIARDLLSRQLTRERYADILCVWHRAWVPLETAIWSSHWSHGVRQLLPVRRGAKAQRDLHALGLKGSANSTVGTDATLAKDWVDSEAALLGLCYVVRGSSLGGQVIARHLESTLGLNAAHGSSFFTPDTDEALSWPRWCRHIDDLLLDGAAKDRACATARAAFSHLLQTFTASVTCEPATL